MGPDGDYCFMMPHEHSQNLATIASLRSGYVVEDKNVLVKLLMTVDFACASIPENLHASINKHGRSLKPLLYTGWVKDDIGSILVTKADLIEGIGLYLYRKRRRFTGGLAKAPKAKLEAYIKHRHKATVYTERARDKRVAEERRQRDNAYTEYRSWKPGDRFSMTDSTHHCSERRVWCITEYYRSGFRCTTCDEYGRVTRRHIQFRTMYARITRRV